MIYLDYYSTSPLERGVLEVMLPFFSEKFYNPLSKNKMGKAIRHDIEEARCHVAALINAAEPEVIFTSSGTEANNTIIKGLSFAYEKKGKHIITSKSEHHSVLNPMRSLERIGFNVTFLSPDINGEIKPEAIERVLREDTMLVSINFASVDVGTVNNIKAISNILNKKDILFHTDAVAAVGNMIVDVKDLGVDALSFSSHVFGGPKGVGGFYLRDGLRLMPLIYGGPQEFGKRAGTENVAGIVGLGKAAQIARSELPYRVETRNKMLDVIKEIFELDGVLPIGSSCEKLPGHLVLLTEGIESERMVSFLEENDIYVSSGSPCVSYSLKASPMLMSMGYSFKDASCVMTLSTSHITTQHEVESFVTVFKNGLKKLR